MQLKVEKMYIRLGGVGGSWNDTNWPKFQQKAWGMPLIYGGVGGVGCDS